MRRRSSWWAGGGAFTWDRERERERGLSRCGVVVVERMGPGHGREEGAGGARLL